MVKVLKLHSFYDNIKNGPGKDQYEPAHFNIVRIEDMLFTLEAPLNYRRRSYYKISLVKGSSTIHYPGHRIVIGEAALVFTNPLMPYDWERNEEKQEGYVCIFTEDFLPGTSLRDLPAFRFAENTVVELQQENFGKFEALIIRMDDELRSDYLYRSELIRSLLTELIFEAQKMVPATVSPQAGSNASERLAVSFMRLLEREMNMDVSYRKPCLLSPADYAGRLAVHVNYLNKVLKEITGQTTTQLINARILSEATVLLKNTKLMVSEIAWALGFSHPNHFSSFIKKQTGLNPKTFRNSK
ncbi:helix-turn-helix domain-containing protein [Mucilaginibacter pallidiroseus]|uniref:Helix-turn-helix domain-containing protein n=1 Tax=Mucilaginibacter pallidiroseus TaxID=2599295 RepID=A0A563U1T2_9SPHI|nr:AraC family transcriptional regulator [Mucilaginibacter pallidiroseus]TWR24419.1 helix-turn-helix domain-containing protein [Mucilaginibacter pallidiroseus]